MVSSKQSSNLSHFNPRSHEGSDSFCLRQWWDLTDFNPRSHEGSDIGSIFVSEFKYISTRAPTRGATVPALFDAVILDYFNPRSHEGSDIDAALTLSGVAGFQPALPRGERPIHLGDGGTGSTFQPALPRGERQGGNNGGGIKSKISTRAPTRGATSGSKFTFANQFYFNPRSHEGSDLPYKYIIA